jgi:hypothetical protein
MIFEQGVWGQYSHMDIPPPHNPNRVTIVFCDQRTHYSGSLASEVRGSGGNAPGLNVTLPPPSRTIWV